MTGHYSVEGHAILHGHVQRHHSILANPKDSAKRALLVSEHCRVHSDCRFQCPELAKPFNQLRACRRELSRRR
ncbi:MAG: hypothetical protein KC492_16205 [Myxococcales bacterium]|nr:hypothetical protein [Myxococcales bacterium]